MLSLLAKSRDSYLAVLSFEGEVYASSLKLFKPVGDGFEVYASAATRWLGMGPERSHDMALVRAMDPVSNWTENPQGVWDEPTLLKVMRTLSK